MLDLSTFDPISLYRIAAGESGIGFIKIVREVETHLTPFDLPTQQLTTIWQGEAGAIKLLALRDSDTRSEQGTISTAVYRCSIQVTDAAISTGDFAFVIRKQGGLQFKGVINQIDRKLSRIVLYIDQSQNVPIDFTGVGFQCS